MNNISTVHTSRRSRQSIKGLLIFAIGILICPAMIIYSAFAFIQTQNTRNSVLEETLPYAAKIAADAVSKTDDLSLEALMGQIKISSSANATVISSEGIIAGYEDIDSSVKSAALAGDSGVMRYKSSGKAMLAAYAPIDGKDGLSVVISAPLSDFNDQINKTNILIAGLLIVFTLYAIFGLSVVIPKLAKPLSILISALVEMSKGNYNLDIPDVGDTYKELITLNDSIITLKSNTTSVITDIDYVLGEMAIGNFIVQSKVPEEYVGDYATILNAQATIKRQLTNTLCHILEISEQVSGGAEQVSNGAQSLACGTTEQAGSVEELSATIGDVARQLNESASEAGKASALTVETGDIVADSANVMAQASAAMDEISETSKNISKVIKAIDDIAFQTNILALNAAVEAARAGSAGKGFAVVADEVRNLSQKSAEAAKSTASLIESTIEAVEKGGKLVTKANEDFAHVALKSGEIRSIVGELSTMFQQQAVAANQISQGIEQIAAVVHNNSATSEESAAASEELSSQAIVLKNLVAQFKLESAENAY